MAGALRPAQHLLALDHASEASWLGGVPFFGLWSAGGIFALAAVPLIAALLLTRQIRRAAPRNAGALAAVFLAPLIVLAAEQSMTAIPHWAEAQRRQAALSTNGRLIVPAGSGHAIHWEQPALVIDAVRQVVDAVRSR